MSVQPIVEILTNMTQLHESLLTISKSKTDALKKGNMELLQDLLVQERKHAKAINQLEEKRIEMIGVWSEAQGLDATTTTVSVMLDNHLQGSEKDSLEKVTTKLAQMLVQLKQQEQLNKDLTKQSLQFIQLSLDMIAPTIKNINYGNQAQKRADQGTKRSVFDSKA
ncbi:flagellar protein FlgN [Aquibacillus rhizosphaerae]|uniref:Flagellar protein FlgN n=1 Tax=Aquibacillus rhizosphaerae TaxID=3051431 RepID=A0ABT7L074_9BACI|nr:flagellar protein FlgN [Aquibacillus sp. LR5S19]MDL4839217.1 flagellar protein FlgN [Aquibacillus sp. LR5S19]